MNYRTKAVYRNGAFVPEKACDLPEESEVELFVQGPPVIPPEVTDPEEKQRILEELIESFERNPIPPGAPRFTREELHERR
jgi:hypothetical protein